MPRDDSFSNDTGQAKKSFEYTVKSDVYPLSDSVFFYLFSYTSIKRGGRGERVWQGYLGDVIKGLFKI
jgi:hypothetical protein